MRGDHLTPRPDPLPLANRVLGDLVQGPLFFAATAFFGTLSLTASLFEKDGRIQHQIARVWAAISMRIALSPVTVVGEENLRRHPVAVYAANHLSYMDTPVLFSSVPFQFRILARQSLWTVPFIGWHLNRSGQIPVDTGNPKASTLKAGVKALKAGMPLIVFGRRADKDGHPGRRFMSGPAFMAIQARVPFSSMAIVGRMNCCDAAAALLSAIGKASGWRANRYHGLFGQAGGGVDRSAEDGGWAFVLSLILIWLQHRLWNSKRRRWQQAA